MRSDRIPVRHGYTMNDLQRLAEVAVRDNLHMLPRWNHAEQIEEAWGGIVEALCAAETRPEATDLIYAGYKAVANEAHKRQAAHGARTGERYTGRNFERFWSLASSPTASHEERVVERVALEQIWRQLTAKQRQALNAYAAADGITSVAQDLVGVSNSSFNERLARARATFLRLWHEHETPSRQWRSNQSGRAAGMREVWRERQAS